MAHKAAWDRVVRRESKEVLGQPDLVVDRVFKAAPGRLGLKELRVSKDSKVLRDRQDSKGLKEAWGPQDPKEIKEV